MIVLQMTDFKLPDALHLGIGSTVEKMSRLKRKKKNNLLMKHQQIVQRQTRPQTPS